MSATVLIADASIHVAEHIRDCFFVAGYSVVGLCNDGVSALSMLKTHRPTVATLDLLLPRLSGLRVIAAARAAGLDTKFIAISGVSQPDRMTAARTQGFAYYLVKPFDPGSLADIASELASREHSDAYRAR